MKDTSMDGSRINEIWKKCMKLQGDGEVCYALHSTLKAICN